MRKKTISIIIATTMFVSYSIAAPKKVNSTPLTKSTTLSQPAPVPVEPIRPVIPGIIDAFQSPFLYVYGTQSDDIQETRLLKRTVEDVIRFWKLGRDRDEQYKADTEVTWSDITSYHLLLYGSPSSNSIIRQIYKQLPILIDPPAVVAGKNRFTNDGIGVIMIHPNPLYPKKYVVVYWGSNRKATRWINSVPYGKTDYVIFDERSFLLPKVEQPEPPVVEKGMFDKTDPAHWKYVPPIPEVTQPSAPHQTGTQPPIRTETSFE
ncbi:MAG: hypothetical protein N3A72_02600 [bacterium]|nr:hypothetical protein [bacterium]